MSSEMCADSVEIVIAGSLEAPVPEVRQFFGTIFDSCGKILDLLEVYTATYEDPVEFGSTLLLEEFLNSKDRFVHSFPLPSYRIALKDPTLGRFQGLNTIGSLTDRLFVLAVKEWHLRVRRRDRTAAQIVREGEVAAVLDVLAMAMPGPQVQMNKVVSQAPSKDAGTLDSNFFDLLKVHACQWEILNISYLSDEYVVPLESYKKLTNFGRELNLERSVLVRHLNERYWTIVLSD